MLSTASLSSYKVDYLDSTVSSQLVDTIITQQIAALNDAGNNPMDLFLGATGKILLNVNGSNSLQISNSNAMTSIVSTAGLGLQLVPTDTTKTMVLGSVTFTETSTAQNMITNKPKLNIVSDLQLTGNEVVTGDLLTAGALVAVPATKKAGGWLGLATVVAVYPANIQMAVDASRGQAQVPGPAWVAWARLPLQLPMLRDAWRLTR